LEHWREFPRTGKRGRPRKPKIVPSDDLKYAQVVKTRVNRVLEKVGEENRLWRRH